MILKSLELQGFKSFPDKTKLLFDRGMTAVVGPNGSGKSNISDAVRWVLGEQSTKNLRGSKMEDVIFDGTGRRKAMGYAEVRLSLDNSDGRLSDYGEELSVSRRYYRSGESVYMINGEQVRLKDLTELFMDTGLGRAGYSIVSQRRVSQLISEKSRERRDVLEEAAGISHFRYRRADALRRLEQTEDNLLRLRDIAAELESRVGPLKKQSEKAEKFLVWSEEKKELEISIWLRKLTGLKSKLRDVEHKAELTRLQYGEAEERLATAEKQIEEAEEAVRALNCEIDELYRGGAQRQKELSELSAKINDGENKIAYNLQSVQRLEEEKESFSTGRGEREKKLAEIRTEEAELEEKRKEKEVELSGLRLKAEAGAFEDEKNKEEGERLREGLAALSSEAASCRAFLISAEAARSEEEERFKRAAELSEEKKEEAKGLEAAKAEAERALLDATERAEALSNTLGGYELKAQQRTKKAQEKSEFSERLRGELYKAESELRVLRELEKNMEGYSGSVKEVMKAASASRLRGIHGPLSKLISTEKKYSTAIETALGPALQYIVTENESDAKAAIRHLKEAKAGRATFLPLSSIKGRELRESGLSKCRGYIAAAEELVSADEKYSELIHFLLGRCAVAEDLDSAVEIGRKYKNSFKTVSLDGQVINAGGSMTGGSAIRNAGLLSRSGRIEEKQRELSEKQEKLSLAEAEARSASEEAEREKAVLEGARAELQTAAEEGLRLEGELRLAEEKAKASLSAQAELERVREASRKKLEAFSEELSENSKKEELLKKQIAEIEEEAKRLGGSADKLREERERTAEKSKEAEMELLALSMKLQSNRDSQKQLSEQEEISAEREREIVLEKKALEEERLRLEAENADFAEQIERLKAKDSEDEKRTALLSEQRDEREAEKSSLREDEKGGAAEREALGGELARLEERKAAVLGEAEETENKFFDEYQLTGNEAAEKYEPAEELQSSKNRLFELREKIRGLGSVNVGAVEEYREISERYKFLSAQIADVESSKKELEKLTRELTKNMAERFRDRFYKINKAFSETFTELFDGGKAELLIEDGGDILESPIEIRMQPPGKNIKNIDLLSNGEKGLSAIALLFAILKINPCPFCILDEVEAALDDVNVGRYAQYVRRMTGNTQFILITHRRGTMEEADILYGVTMQEEGVSKLLELNASETVKRLGLE